jgi:hypothetical protein
MCKLARAGLGEIDAVVGALLTSRRGRDARLWDRGLRAENGIPYLQSAKIIDGRRILISEGLVPSVCLLCKVEQKKPQSIRALRRRAGFKIDCL